MIKVEFKYDIGDKVKVKDITVNGRVTGLLKDDEGIQYRVAYWYNGERKSTWMFDWEIEESTDEKKISL